LNLWISYTLTNKKKITFLNKNIRRIEEIKQKQNKAMKGNKGTRGKGRGNLTTL
jgi:hypothetical protein